MRVLSVALAVVLAVAIARPAAAQEGSANDGGSPPDDTTQVAGESFDAPFGDSDPDSLAFTGFDVLVMLAVAGALVVAGTVAWRIGRSGLTADPDGRGAGPA
jgi:hypothetical protein